MSVDLVVCGYDMAKTWEVTSFQQQQKMEPGLLSRTVPFAAAL